ncbi:hypothetical protein B0H21DRAFT_895656, partial [Amylocystis lapponica]
CHFPFRDTVFSTFHYRARSQCRSLERSKRSKPSSIVSQTGFSTREGCSGNPDSGSSVTFVIIPNAPGPIYIELQLPPRDRFNTGAAGASTLAGATKRTHDDVSSDGPSHKKSRHGHENTPHPRRPKPSPRLRAPFCRPSRTPRKIARSSGTALQDLSHLS